MKILVTGATGLIGKPMVSKLVSEGHSVNYLSSSRLKLASLDGAFGYYWDPARGEIDESALIGVDVIINLAGAPISRRWTPDQKQKVLESRVLALNLLFRTLKNNPHQVVQVVSASGIGIYPHSLTEEYTEDYPHVAPGFLGQVVEKWESSVRRFSSLGIRVSIIRTGLVLSPDGGALAEMEKPVRMGLGAPLGSGKQVYSWIHIDDLVCLYHYVVEHALDGVFNAVAPNPVTNNEMTGALSKQLEKPYFLPAVPRFVLKLMLGEMHLLVTEGQRVSAQKIIGAGFRFGYPYLDEALRDIYEKSPGTGA